MPSTATLTTFYSFTPATVIASAEVNNNFSVFRGHLLPVDPTASSSPTLTYDLGSDDHRWRRVYGKPWLGMVSTSGSMTIVNTQDLVFMDSTAATITATFFAVANNTGASFTIKNIGTANTIFYDGNAAETIDDTITGNIMPDEAITFYCTGVQWRKI